VENTVIPDLRGPLGRDPDSTSVGFVLWMPAYAGMTNYVLQERSEAFFFRLLRKMSG
jgi:hypothetical protein